MMLPTADLLAKNDISYGGHFCRMGNPVTVTVQYSHIQIHYKTSRIELNEADKKCKVGETGIH